MAGPTLDSDQLRLLATILERGSESASQALSKWLGRSVRLEIAAVEQVEVETVTEAIGPGDTLVAAAAMRLADGLSGQLLLVFEDRAGLALADLLLGRPIGSARDWGELEVSAAQETANIVGCAYVNALATHLPGGTRLLMPGPPEFRHEFAASLIEFAVFDQAAHADRVLLIQTRFHAEPSALEWSLLFVPSGEALEQLARTLVV
jgi:chemotaxis protein CheC